MTYRRALWTFLLTDPSATGTVCGANDGAPPAGGGGGVTPPAVPPAAAAAAAAAAGAPPAPPAPPAAPPPVDVAALQAAHTKLQADLASANARMQDPAFHRDILKQVLGNVLGEEPDPKAKLESLTQKATTWETLAKRTAREAAVMSAAAFMGAQAPDDVARLVDLSGVELDADLRVKNTAQVTALLTEFKTRRPFMFRVEGAAAAPPAGPPGAGVHTPVPPAGPGPQGGGGEFRVLSQEEINVLPMDKARAYLAQLRAMETTGSPWRGTN